MAGDPYNIVIQLYLSIGVIDAECLSTLHIYNMTDESHHVPPLPMTSTATQIYCSLDQELTCLTVYVEVERVPHGVLVSH